MMRILNLILSTAILALATSAQAQKIVNPDWLEKPSGEQIAEHYPKLAELLEIEGRSLISCEINAKGALKECEIIDEAPVGLGFGAATLEVAKSFKMSPKQVDGKAVDGGTIRIPLHFTLPSNPPAPKQGRTAKTNAEVFGPPSARAVELGRQVVAAQDLTSQARVQYEVSIMPLVDARWPGIDDKVRDDGIEAMRLGFAKFMETLEGAMARSYATNFSEAELTDIAAFLGSPAGQAYTRRQLDVMQAVASTMVTGPKLMAATARALFCANHPCSSVLKPTTP